MVFLTDQKVYQKTEIFSILIWNSNAVLVYTTFCEILAVLNYLEQLEIYKYITTYFIILATINSLKFTLDLYKV